MERNFQGLLLLFLFPFLSFLLFKLFQVKISADQVQIMSQSLTQPALQAAGGGDDKGPGKGDSNRGGITKKRYRGKCGVCGRRGHYTHDHWKYSGGGNTGAGTGSSGSSPVINIAGPVYGGVSSSSHPAQPYTLSRHNVRGRRGRGRGAFRALQQDNFRGEAAAARALQDLEQATLQQQRMINELIQRNTELSNQLFVRGPVEEDVEAVAGQATEAPSTTDGLDEDIQTGLRLNSGGEEMDTGDGQVTEAPSTTEGIQTGLRLNSGGEEMDTGGAGV
ncbi:unnamed protein product [Penicillium viridicatum]